MLTSNMRFASLAVYSRAGVSCWIPAAAMSPSRRECLSAISCTMVLRVSASRTSIRRYSRVVFKADVARFCTRKKSSEGVSRMSRAYTGSGG